MFKEITLTEAFERFKNGENGIVIRRSSDDGFEVMAFEKFFSGIPNDIRFLADVEEKVSDPFERYAKRVAESNPEPKQKRHRPNQKEIEQNILKAWDCGNRSFDEVVKRTGYSAKTVERFLPHNCKA